MRVSVAAVAMFILSAVAAAQTDQDFSGVWKFNPAHSEVHGLPVLPDAFMKVEQNAAALTVSGSNQESSGFSAKSIYPLNGKAEKGKLADSTTNTATKWEGSALLVSTLVSGPQNYTVMERWVRSRDGNTLTIKRTIVRLSGESESVLVYENPSYDPPLETRQLERAPAPRQSGARPSQDNSTEFVVEAGTRMLLRLVNSVNTKSAVAGDRVYLETAIPVFVNGRLVIPRGSYVNGTVLDSRQAGRVKGKSELRLRFDSLTLPNGVSRDFRSLPGSVDTRGDLNRKEGKIEGEGNKGGDTRRVGETTAAGAGVGAAAGAAAGHLGMGAGIGAAAGAAAGLAGVLGSRGPQVVMPAGTTMELVLDRDLRYTSIELYSRAQ
jgi:hypothetical protein